MEASKNALDLIKRFEGCQLMVYMDRVGVKTIGYGHTGKDVNDMILGTKITKEQAQEYLFKDIVRAEDKVNAYDRYNFTQNQFDALVSFAFNIGNIDQLTNNGTRTIAEISAKIPEYRKAGGQVVPGLVTRRAAEKELFDRKEEPKDEH